MTDIAYSTIPQGDKVANVVLYQYRHPDGTVFHTMSTSLENCKLRHLAFMRERRRKAL